MPLNDILHQRFGRLRVIGRTSGHLWRCACDCGGYAEVQGTALSSGRQRSCGCLMREEARKRGMLKSVMVRDGDGNVFASVREAARAEGVDPSVIRGRVARGTRGWAVVDADHARPDVRVGAEKRS